jgi:DNA-binding response OmpR family regulator
MQEQIQTLVVDDDEGIRFFLAEVLAEEGHKVVIAPSGEEALQRLRDTGFDLAMLDLRLGGRVDGLRVLQAISWRWPGTAAIILTGHGTLDSAMEAIREGVDAYLLKPVKAGQIRQVVAEVLEKRQQVAAKAASPEPERDPSLLQRGDFAVDLQRNRATMDGHLLDLTTCEYDLLVHLMENDDRPVPPPELVKVVRGYECDHLHEARDIIKWYIYSLRRRVEPNPSSPRHILNVRGVGYIFKA